MSVFKLIGVSLLGVSVLGGAGVGVYYYSLPKTLGDKLSNTSGPWLNLDPENKDINHDKWSELVQKYKKTENRWKVNNLSVDNNGDDEEIIKKIKGACKELFNLNIGSEEYDEKEKTAKNWCLLNSSGNADKGSS